MSDSFALQPGEVTIRHIKLGASTDSGAKQVLGYWYVPQPLQGVNGKRGFQKGMYERRLFEEGRFALTFPNAAGEDGVLHRQRFEILRTGKRIPTTTSESFSYGGGSYRPGEEWIEIYWRGDLIFVGTPTRAQITRSTVEISGFDALWLLKKTRDTATAFWQHSPRDAFECYTHVWQTPAADDFEDTTKYTSSFVEQTTTDGRWVYLRSASNTYPGFLLMQGMNTGAATIRPHVSYAASIVPKETWRVEWKFYTERLPAGWISPDVAGLLRFQIVRDSAPTTVYTEMRFTQADPTLGSDFVIAAKGDGSGFSTEVTQSFYKSTKFLGTTADIGSGTTKMEKRAVSVACEIRDKWIYWYQNEELMGTLPAPNSTSTDWLPRVYVEGGSNLSDQQFRLSHFLWRKTRPFLLGGASSGEYRLPGAPTPGGLLGTYYDEGSYRGLTNEYLLRHNPTRTPYARRVDATIPWTALNTPTSWPPVGPISNEYFSVRWTGAIFLDLATNDRFIRFTSDDRVRVWIGRTMREEQLINDWTSGGHGATAFTSASVRAHLAAVGSVNLTGWYPIVIDFQQGGSAAAAKLEWATTVGGTYSIIPADKLSPNGAYSNQSRFESHADQIQSIGQAFGYQYTCSPRQLESGEFPGQTIPRIREGRDTEEMVDGAEATDIAVEVNAEDTADSLLVDAAGIADPNGSGQLTMEAVNFGNVSSKPVLNQKYESLADIGFPELLTQRANSILALSGSAWEETSARPRGHRKLLDKFPLSNQVADFSWLPGDGARLYLPEIDVVDASPRQILAVEWPLVPDGLGRPSVSFRQRPRDLPTLIRQIQSTYLKQSRNYQGQLVALVGTTGSNNIAATVATDNYSRLVLPPDVGTIVEATYAITSKADATAWNVEVNGTVVRSASTAGHYDVSSFIARAGGTEPRMYARLVTTGASTGHWEGMLFIVVRI